MPRSISDNDTRLQAIADCLGLPVAVFFDEPAEAEPKQLPTDDLMRAVISAAETYMRARERAARSVSLAGQS